MKKKFLLLTIAVTIVSLVSSCEKKRIKGIEASIDFVASDEGGEDCDGDLPIIPLDDVDTFNNPPANINN